MFAVAMTLWLAALFGLGTLAASPTLIASVAPFGTRSQFAIAIAMAVLGGAFGLVIARLVARPELKRHAETFEPSLNQESIGIAPDCAPEPPAEEIAGAQGSQALAPEAGPSIDAPAAAEMSVHDAPKILNVREIRFKGLAPGADEDALEAPGTTMPADSLDSKNARHAGKRGDSAAERIANADLNDLSSLQLMERLALGLNARRGNATAATHARDHPLAVSLPEAVEIGLAAGQGRIDTACPDPAGQNPAPQQDPEQTEQALRDALAALQRLSRTA